MAVTTVTTDTLCEGESYQLVASGADRYSWSPATGLSDSSIANPVARPATTTLYTVVGTDYRGCFYDTASVPVVVYPIPDFNIINDKITTSSGTVIPIQTTSSPDIIRWRWIPSYGLSCTDCPQPVLTAGRDITYRVVVFNEGGCRSEETLVVTVTCNEGNVYVPNTFSPNNDGMNDVFFPRGKGVNMAKSIRIFNRWGGIVFQRQNFSVNDAAAGWNGMYNNQLAPADVYVYELEVICENNQVINHKGNITLLR
jgi:gliding motility-associated-like protein